jgi:D-arabinose 1-dehydrogenase-like Zn-dependent alcohol dehydrogenase
MSASLDSFEANTVERYAPSDDDVVFDIKFCGICHTVRARSSSSPAVCKV